MLYGGGEPGGLINYVTKKPAFERNTEVATFAGNYDLFGTSFDTTGPIPNLNNIAYRAGIFFEDRDTFRNNSDATNLQVVGGLAFQLGNKTDLTLTFDYIDQDLGGNRLRGMPVDDAGNFLTDISFNTNEKNDFQRLKAKVAQAIANHSFTNNLEAKVTVRVLDNERTQNYHESRGLLADGRSITREFRDQLRENTEWSITTDVIYRTELMGMEHTLLAGMDYFDQKAAYLSRTTRGAASRRTEYRFI